jgi:hypothetical protein
MKNKQNFLQVPDTHCKNNIEKRVTDFMNLIKVEPSELQEGGQELTYLDTFNFI